MSMLYLLTGSAAWATCISDRLNARGDDLFYGKKCGAQVKFGV